MKALLIAFVVISLSGFSQKVDTIIKIKTAQGHTFYKVSCDNIYLSSLYFNKAGKNITAGGVLMGLSITAAIIPNFISNATKDVYLGCGIASGLFMIGSVMQFCIGGNQLKKGAIILRSTKSYTLEINGSHFNFKF